MLNNNSTGLLGEVDYIKDNQSVPLSQDSLVFIMNENPSCEEKIKNITNDSGGCILIANKTGQYTYTNASNENFTIVRVNGSNSNFISMINETEKGYNFTVNNFQNDTTLTFFNLSTLPYPNYNYPWVGVFDLDNHSEDFNYPAAALLNANYYLENMELKHLFNKCQALILAGPGDTHYMLPTTYAWQWIGTFLNNRYAWMPCLGLPMFSVNASIGKWLVDNEATDHVGGFVDQHIDLQTNNKSGVISHNVVAYRNISHSPNNAIVVLSNRIDNWWNQGPGDSGNGGAILLGIAKYFNDYNITPKYNLTFLFTTGEEYGYRGAQHFIDTHPYGTGGAAKGEYNYITWLGLEQLAFNLTEQGKNLTTGIRASKTMIPLLQAIANQTNYQNRTDGFYNFSVNETHIGGAEDTVWRNNVNARNTILFEKSGAWMGWHCAGNKYTEGDSWSNIDQNDLKVVSELYWNVTKYFTVNPNCSFSDISYTPVSILTGSTDNTTPNAIKATFTIKSILPNDRVMVNASLYDYSSGQSIAHTLLNYTANRDGVEDNVTFMMPTNVQEGDYFLTLDAYNSTAIINRQVHISYEANTMIRHVTDLPFEPLPYPR